VFLEAVALLVVGNNYDAMIQHNWSCLMRAVVSPICTAYGLVCCWDYASSDCSLMKLVDLSPWSRV